MGTFLTIALIAGAVVFVGHRFIRISWRKDLQT